MWPGPGKVQGAPCWSPGLRRGWKNTIFMILYMLYICIIITLLLYSAISIKRIKTWCIKHKNTHFRGASRALARARPGGLFWAPPRRSPKSHFLGYQQLLYINLQSLQWYIINAVYTIELRVLSVRHYISVLGLLFCPFPRAHKGLLSEGF